MKFDDVRSFRNFLMFKEIEAQLNRPPLGVKPWWLAAEQRISAIEGAALRYTLAQQDVPRGWLRERRLLKWALWLGRAPKRFGARGRRVD
jgi:hypothetical protein